MIRDKQHGSPEDGESASVSAGKLDLGDDDAPPKEEYGGPSLRSEDQILGATDEDDSPEVLDALMESDDELGIRSALGEATWPDDADAPDYAHLLGDNLAHHSHGVFELTPAVLDLMIEANRFKPVGPDGTIVFALRGAKLLHGDSVIEQTAVELRDARPDHINCRCVLGYYDRKTRNLSVFSGSTVPNAFYVKNYYKKFHNIGSFRSISANLLPTGCYVYRVSHHRHQVRPALRLTEPHFWTSEHSHPNGEVTVLRSRENLIYESHDYWDKCRPTDNIHDAGRTDNTFSSAGCLTIEGRDESRQGGEEGPWKDFQNRLRDLTPDTRIDVVLLTGKEAAIASWIVGITDRREKERAIQKLTRLRPGSHGPEVREMQIKLGFTGKTEYFGRKTKLKLTEFQAKQTLRPDGVFSHAVDAQLGWGILDKPALNLGAATAPRVYPPARLTDFRFLSELGSGGIVVDGRALVRPGQGIWTADVEKQIIHFWPEQTFVGDAAPVRFVVEDAEKQTKAGVASASVKPAPTDRMKLTTTQGRAVAFQLPGGLDGKFANPEAKFTVSEDRKRLEIENQGVWQIERDNQGSVLVFTPKNGFKGQARPIEVDMIRDGQKVEQKTVRIDVVSGALEANSAEHFAVTEKGEPVTIALFRAPGMLNPESDEQHPVSIGNAQVEELVSVGEAPVNIETMRRLAPRGKMHILAGLADNVNELKRYGILDTPLRWCHFISQCCHESDGFQTLEEYASGAAYEGRQDLGNNEPGDGRRYKGRGMIQLTGRYNYREVGGRLNLPLEQHPEHAADPRVSVLTAAEFWRIKKLNRLADEDDVVRVTKKINGGRRGLADRKRLLKRAKQIWLQSGQTRSGSVSLRGADGSTSLDRIYAAARNVIWSSILLATLAFTGAALALVYSTNIYATGWGLSAAIWSGLVAMFGLSMWIASRGYDIQDEVDEPDEFFHEETIP